MNTLCNFLTIPFPSGKASVCISLAAAGDMGTNSESESSARRNFLKSTGFTYPEPYPLVLEQVHSHIIYDAEELSGHRSWKEGLLKGDGIISRAGEPIGITVADCVPIFLLDTRLGITAGFHSGWKGTGIAEEGVERMVQDYGSRNCDIEAVIGPAIGGCCYRVDQERYDYFLRTFGNVGLKKYNNYQTINLKLINYDILSKLNLKNIYISDRCTCCDTQFFSYRRMGAERFGRMLAYIRSL